MSGTRAGIPKTARGEKCQPKVCLCGREIGEHDPYLLGHNGKFTLAESEVVRIALTHNGDPHAPEAFLDLCAHVLKTWT